MTPSRLRTELSLPKLVAEFVVLVVGVLLALAVDEWRDGRENARLAEAALRNVGRELAENRAAVARRLPYHVALRDSIARDLERTATWSESGLRLRPGGRLRPPVVMGFRNGFALAPALTATAWETAVAANVLGFLDYATTTVLAQAYAGQAEVTDAADGLTTQFPLILGGLYAGDDQLKAALVTQAALEDLVLRQRAVLARYDAALGHLRRRLPSAPWDSASDHAPGAVP